MAELPKFPLTGTTLSKNVGLDRVSLFVNTVGSSLFPAGQYVFFTKAQSTFYRKKPINGAWSDDILLISNVSESHSAIDANGYPVTAYEAADGTLKVHYYESGIETTTTLASAGSFPTVVVDTNDTYVVWAPPNYTDHLLFAQHCSAYAATKPYAITLPGSINMMNVTVTPDNKWLFAFEVIPLNGTSKVYIAFTNPFVKFATTDLVMFTTFMTGFMLNDYFVIAELFEANNLNVGVFSEHAGPDAFTIAEVANNAKLNLIPLTKFNLNEYFIVAQQSDNRVLNTVLLKYALGPESFYVSESKTLTTLIPVPYTNGKLNEYFVVSESTLTDLVRDVTPVSRHYSEIMSIADPKETSQLLFIQQNKPVFQEYMILSDQYHSNDDGKGNGTNYVLTTYFFPKNIKIPDYFVLDDSNSFPPGNYVFTSLSNIIDYTDGSLTEIPSQKTDPYSRKRAHDVFYVADSKLNFSQIALTIYDVKFRDSCSIKEVSPTFLLIANIYYFNTERFQIGEQGLPIAGPLISGKHASLSETLQIPDVLTILTSSQRNYSKTFSEAMSIVFANVSASQGLLPSQFAHFIENNLYINNQIIVNVVQTNPTIKIKVLDDFGPYNYYALINAPKESRLLTFTNASTVEPLYFYFVGTTPQLRSGPQHYNVAVVEQVPGVTLTPIVHS